MESRILLATPISLIGLLKTVAYGWSQLHIAENAKNIALQGKELYSRLLKFFEHIFKIGKAMDGAVKSHNDAVGSLENRLLPATGKFKELVNAAEEIQEPEPIERNVLKPAKK
jgi:DNA recombination protein RmuC